MAIITLLTDYGPVDSYVGELRGVLLSRLPGVTLADLTHAIPPGDVTAAAYVLSRCWSRFPAGTVHLAVVDPGVGTARAALALGLAGHFFVGPDNGLFGPVLRSGPAGGVELAVPAGASPTFHGRDLFAPAAAALAAGAPLESLGVPLSRPPAPVSGPRPRHQGKTLVGEVVYVDRYGNLVTNLTPADVPSYAVLETDGSEIGPIRLTFGDVPSGGLVAYIGSGGEIEIGVRDGSATRRLGLGVGGRVRARLG
jgi:S-adenosyl-L-methionine hydrolase (adenosine-forming)